MKTKIFFGALAFLCVSFMGCKNDVDTTKPTIHLHEPEEGTALRIGSDVHFEMDLEDDIMLSSYMIEIHSNFDNHGHKAHHADSAHQETKPFFMKRSYDVSKMRNTHIHHHDIVIPENATPGNYHLMVYCSDAAGNQSSIARNIVLSHDAEHHDHDHHDHDHDHEHEHEHE